MIWQGNTVSRTVVPPACTGCWWLVLSIFSNARAGRYIEPVMKSKLPLLESDHQIFMNILQELQDNDLLQLASPIEAHMLAQSHPRNATLRTRLSATGEPILPVLFVTGSNNIISKSGQVLLDLPCNNVAGIDELLSLAASAVQPVVMSVVADDVLYWGLVQRSEEGKGHVRILQLQPIADGTSPICTTQDFCMRKDEEHRATYRMISWLRSRTFE